MQGLAVCLMAVVTLTLTLSVTAQPFQFTPEPYHPMATEAAQRKMSNYTGFKFTISQAAVCARVDLPTHAHAVDSR